MTPRAGQQRKPQCNPSDLRISGPGPPLSPKTRFFGGETPDLHTCEAESSPHPSLPWALPGINIPLGL